MKTSSWPRWIVSQRPSVNALGNGSLIVPSLARLVRGPRVYASVIGPTSGRPGGAPYETGLSFEHEAVNRRGRRYVADGMLETAETGLRRPFRSADDGIHGFPAQAFRGKARGDQRVRALGVDHR
jgi:hypothetical protein